MGTKSITISVGFLAAFLFFAAAGLMAKEAPEEVIIDNEGYKLDVRGAVEFSHLNHAEDYDVECRHCHHMWNGEDPVKKCIACHPPAVKQGRIRKLTYAYHLKCRTCHKKLTEGSEPGDEEVPFRDCSGCHQED